MRTDEKVKAVCNDAGVELATGAMALVAAMSWLYGVIQNLGDLFINLVR